jgi:hypothetical protein
MMLRSIFAALIFHTAGALLNQNHQTGGNFVVRREGSAKSLQGAAHAEDPFEGSYRESCNPCFVSDQTLSCTCKGGPDPSTQSSLDLTSCSSPLAISNENGRLSCARIDTFVRQEDDWKAALMKAAPSGDKFLKSFRECKITQSKKSFHHLCHLFLVSNVMQMHIYKNAGSTIEDVLHQKGGQGFQHGDAEGHYSQDALREMIKNEPWFRTAIVRDPMDRAVSAFHEVKARMGTPELFDVLPEEMRSEYARAGYEQGCLPNGTGLLDDFQKMLDNFEQDENPEKRVPFGFHFLTQTHFVTDEQGEKLPLDYIGDFKDLLREEKFLMKDENLELPHNSGPFDAKEPDCRVENAKLPLQLQRSICRIYLDDYCCFGFPLPEACSDMVCPTA